METQNLWPDFVIETIKSPKAILKEQAGYLIAKTNNVLSADVETSHYKNDISHEFYVVAPALNNYRYRLFSVSHGIVNYYPLTVDWHNRMPWEGESQFKAENQQGFLDILGIIFNAPDPVKIISSLMSQSLAE